MSKWLKRLIWLVAAFALVWLSVIVYWQSTTRLPSESDLLLYMGLLPLTIFGLGWVGHWAITKPASEQNAPVVQTVTKKQAEQAAQKEQERDWAMGIVATSLHTGQGRSSAEVLDKLKEGNIQPVLDPVLLTPEGFPVFSARIADLDCSATQVAFGQWRSANSIPSLQWTEQQHRTLHLVFNALKELTAGLVAHPDLVQLQKKLSLGRPIEDDAVVPLRLFFVWPTRWTFEHQTVASAWAKSLVAACGWPEHRLLLQSLPSAPQETFALLDLVTVTTHRAQLPAIGIVMACDSGIDQDFVDELDTKELLYSGKNASGIKPGEVAAGVLFADADQCQCLDVKEYALLHRASWATRDKSADAKGRSSSELLNSLSVLALETAKLSPKDIPLICADNDHRPSREAELAEVLNDKFPDLDSMKDVGKVAQACGSVHPMLTMATLCVAHQHVLNEKKPVLCLSLHDPLWRGAVVLNAHFA